MRRNIRPDQGVRQQLGKNAIFATIGKLGTSQKVVVQKDPKPSPKVLSRAPSHSGFKKQEQQQEEGAGDVVLMFDDRSFGELPSPEQKGKEGTAGPSMVPAVITDRQVVKPLSFMLDVPEDKMLVKRKNAVKIVQSLLPKVPDIDAIGADSEDEKSVISSYFDRTAPPIYAPKTAPTKKRLVSKRFDPVVPKEGSDQAAAADLNKLLSGFSAEEKLLFESLDEEAKLKLIEEIKVCCLF